VIPMRKRVVFYILGILCLVAVAAPWAYAGVIMVGSGSGFDHASIQDAVNASSDGDTIIIAPGIYEENVLVLKRLWIVGSGPATVIRGTIGEPSFYLSCNNTSIRSVSFESGSLFMQLSFDVSIDDCRFTNSSTAIEATDAANLSLTNNVIVRPLFAGVALTGVHNSTIRDNVIEGGAFGLTAYGSANNTIQGNNITDTVAGMMFRRCYGNTVTDNMLMACDNGLLLINTDGQEVAGNTAIDCNDSFMIAFNSNGNLVTNNGVGYGTKLADDIASRRNRYEVGIVNISGVDFEINRCLWTPPEGHVALGDAVNVSLEQREYAGRGSAVLECNVSDSMLPFLDGPTIGFYRLDGAGYTMVSTSSMIEGQLYVNTTPLSTNGTYVLMGKESSGTTCMAPIAMMIVIMGMAYGISRKPWR